MAQSAAEPVQWYVSQGYYGPNCYRRHKWTGELNEAFIEVWQAGSNPVRYELIQNGYSCNDLPTTLGLTISDLFPGYVWEAANIPECDIPFDGAQFVGKLMTAIRKTADGKFFNFIKQEH
ncbi:hypothetical protein LIPSTDRAFT_3563 [Lipomyces starkeyi NRRL Y-11557]|uniref:Uncharacterized protein n=1 Tax=Lipomyces starkeyi NRRL Y-11557 TaxID=675824 RepID=A0A1E3Q6E7_LIPST|nr:hypothetical protein LIPSTDRAFT_3563 [Lipomyces starkeyi NRRL Y-11557]